MLIGQKVRAAAPIFPVNTPRAHPDIAAAGKAIHKDMIYDSAAYPIRPTFFGIVRRYLKRFAGLFRHCKTHSFVRAAIAVRRVRLRHKIIPIQGRRVKADFCRIHVIIADCMIKGHADALRQTSVGIKAHTGISRFFAPESDLQSKRAGYFDRPGRVSIANIGFVENIHSDFQFPI